MRVSPGCSIAFAEHPVLVFREQSLCSRTRRVRRCVREAAAAFAGSITAIPVIPMCRICAMSTTRARPTGSGSSARDGMAHRLDFYETELPLLAILHALEVLLAARRHGGRRCGRRLRGALLPAMKDRAGRSHRAARPHLEAPAGGTLYKENEAAKTADKQYDEKPLAGDYPPPGYRKYRTFSSTRCTCTVLSGWRRTTSGS